MKWLGNLRCFFGFHDWEHYSNQVEFDPGINYNSGLKSDDLVMVCVSNPSLPFSDVGKCASWRKCRCCGEVQICSGSKGFGGFQKEYTIVSLLSGDIYVDLLWNGRSGLRGCYKLMTVKEMKKRYRNFAGIVYNEHISIVPIPVEFRAVHGVRGIDDV